MLFPAPEGPTTATDVPGLAEKVKSFTTVVREGIVLEPDVSEYHTATNLFQVDRSRTIPNQDLLVQYLEHPGNDHDHLPDDHVYVGKRNQGHEQIGKRHIEIDQLPHRHVSVADHQRPPIQDQCARRGADGRADRAQTGVQHRIPHRQPENGCETSEKQPSFRAFIRK